MSLNNSASTTDITLRPSMRALQLLFVLHLLACGLLFFSMDPGQPMAAMAIGFAFSWLWLRRHPVFGYGQRAISRLTWHADGQWTLTEQSGLSSGAELKGNSIVHPRLIVLNFQLKDGSRRSRAILGDEATPATLQKLRARLAVPSASV